MGESRTLMSTSQIRDLYVKYKGDLDHFRRLDKSAITSESDRDRYWKAQMELNDSRYRLATAIADKEGIFYIDTLLLIKKNLIDIYLATKELPSWVRKCCHG